MKITTYCNTCLGKTTQFLNDDDPRYEIVRFCTDLKNKMLDKFEAGALEHGTGWREVDCWKEVINEFVDVLNYFCMEKAKTK